jgi:hypothetical protein
MTRRYINDNGMIKHITLGIVTAPPWTAVPSGSINKKLLKLWPWVSYTKQYNYL